MPAYVIVDIKVTDPIGYEDYKRQASATVFKYAQERGLPMTASSDAHHAAAVGTAYTILNTDDFSVKGILQQLCRSNELNQQYLTPRDSMKKTWNNWLRLRKRRHIPDGDGSPNGG